MGSPIGTKEFVSDFVQDTINDLSKQLEKLSLIARTQPHDAYSSFIHGFFNNFVFLFRTTPDVSAHVQCLEQIIHHKLIPALTGISAINDSFRDLLSLSACMGGMGIAFPSYEAKRQYHDPIHILSH